MLLGLLIALVSLPFVLLLGGPIDLTAKGSVMAAAWLTTAALLQIFVVAPFIMWRDADRAAKRPIAAKLYFSSPYAELVLYNISAKSIAGIDVKSRNHRKPDDTKVTDILQSLPSKDGKCTQENRRISASLN
jgi:hypothetical protein